MAAEAREAVETAGNQANLHEDDVLPRDKHPDGSPMTQDEIDTFWLQRVFKPHVPQLTPRAVIMGMLLGGVMSLSNLYVGLKVGWGLAVTVTAAVLAFGIFSGLRGVGVVKRDFTSLENNTMASAASAAGYFTGAGLTSAIPALYLATGVTIVWWKLGLWILAISFLGVFLAVPMRRQMIDVDRLPFPEGIAYAETIRSLHAAPGEARKKAMALFYGALAGGIIKILNSVAGLAKKGMSLAAPLLPAELGPEAWKALTLGLQTDILMIGAGAMMGVRISLGLLIGAVVANGFLGMWLHSHGLAGNLPTFGSIRSWTVWPGVAIIVVNGLLAFGLKWRTAFAALSGLGKLAKGAQATAKKEGEAGAGNDRPQTMAEVEVPAKWFLRGTIACIGFTVVLAYWFFGIHPLLGLIAALLSVLLSIVACRATGETSITPVGALGKITQLLYGGLAQGNIQTNLIAGSVTAGSAMHSADLLTDLKGGYMLGSRPRHQFVSQFFGVMAGALFCIPIYCFVLPPEVLGTAAFPAPAAKTWQVVAELLAGGVKTESRGAADAKGASVPGIGLAIVPVGTHAGDTLTIAEGANAGSYKIVAVSDKSLVLDPPLPKPAAIDPTACVSAAGDKVEVPEDLAPDAPCPGDAKRGAPTDVKVAVTTEAKAAESKDATTTGPKKLPAWSVAEVPQNTVKGDWIKLDREGHTLWWNVKAVVGTNVIVDRAIVDTRGDKPEPIAGTVKIEARRESLPPYALWATIIASLIAVVLTLLETYLPKEKKKYVPSAAGIGLGFVVAGFDSISMFIGAVIAWAIEKRNKDFAEKYTLASASGIMAGASLIGVLLLALKLAGVLDVH